MRYKQFRTHEVTSIKNIITCEPTKNHLYFISVMVTQLNCFMFSKTHLLIAY
jgi:hypothetical protein